MTELSSEAQLIEDGFRADFLPLRIDHGITAG
jgi:hypothetical protein